MSKNLDILAKAISPRDRRYRHVVLTQGDAEDTHGPAVPSFCVWQIVEECGVDRIGELIRFTWDEFQELFTAIEKCIAQASPGRR